MSLVPRGNFNLSHEFLLKYRDRQPAWGELGYLVFKRTYALAKDDGTTEEFWETCQRVVDGTYQIQKGHCLQHHLPWNDAKAQRSAQEMYAHMFAFKFLPAGRGLAKMGTPALNKVGGACLSSCGFVTTRDIGNSNLTAAFSAPFVWFMAQSMVGVGVGFDTLGTSAHLAVRRPTQQAPYTVTDSREGWCAYLRQLLQSLVDPQTAFPIADYSKVRPKGAIIKGFGGTASGPEALELLTTRLKQLSELYCGKRVDARFIIDVFNSIGECVVAGGVRRTASIAFGSPENKEFLHLKDYRNNPDAAQWPRWASNNSCVVDEDTVFEPLAKLTEQNGEPGYLFLNNARQFGRMKDPANNLDHQVMGANPCQPAWATVLTPEGVRTIADIDTGSLIWSGQEWTKVLKKWSTGIKPIARYQTTAGEFIGTKNHCVIQEGTKIEVQEAQGIDICVGPNLCVSDLNPQDILEGLVIGDGTNNGGSGRCGVVLIIGKDDQDYFTSEVAPLIHERASHFTGTYWKTASQQEHLQALPTRSIPAHAVRGDSQTVRGILRGLFSANGSVIRNKRSGRVTLKTSSPVLRAQVQCLLSSLGIRSYFTTNKSKDVEFNNGTYTCKESYDINISVDRHLFKDLIGFIQNYKCQKLDSICQPLNKYACSRPNTTFDVVNIEQLGKEEVFDLTVAAYSHTYWTGGLLVSNCCEQSLENYEICCLVETFPSKCTDYTDYERALKFAYLYAKTVTLVPTQSPETNAVMLRNRRIGCSQSGIQDNIELRGLRTHLDWCDSGYLYIQQLDQLYSDWLCVPRSKKTTSVKPSGSVSKLANVREGIHESKGAYEMQTIRINDSSSLIARLRDANYRIEEAVNEPNTVVVYFPMKYARSRLNNPTMWEQLELAALMQHYWADNQVSVTIDFDKETEGPEIARALAMYAHRLKGVSFLPREDHGFTQAPKTVITEEAYAAYKAQLKPLDFSDLNTHEVDDQFCSGDVCQRPPKTPATPTIDAGE